MIIFIASLSNVPVSLNECLNFMRNLYYIHITIMKTQFTMQIWSNKDLFTFCGRRVLRPSEKIFVTASCLLWSILIS